MTRDYPLSTIKVKMIRRIRAELQLPENTKPSHRDSPIFAHSSSDPLYVHEHGRSVRTDTRKLWIWGKGKYRNNNSYVWKEVGPDSHQICIEFDGLMFIAEVSSVGKDLLSRSISGYPILKNLLIYLLDDANILPSMSKGNLQRVHCLT